MIYLCTKRKSVTSNRYNFIYLEDSHSIIVVFINSTSLVRTYIWKVILPAFTKQKPYDSNMVRDCFWYESQYLLLLQVYDTLERARSPPTNPLYFDGAQGKCSRTWLLLC